jgi:prolyl oligopeptidase
VARPSARRADRLSVQRKQAPKGAERHGAVRANQRQSIEGVSITRDAILVAGYENVRGRNCCASRAAGNAWATTTIALPENGSVTMAGSSPTESEAFAVFEDFLTPDTLYALDNNATRRAPMRSLPAQFDASPYVSEQYEAVSATARAFRISCCVGATCRSTARTRRCFMRMAASKSR